MSSAGDRAVVRRAGPNDAAVFLELVEALAVYERLEPPNDAARARLLADGFGPAPRFEVYLAEADGVVHGYAIVLETYSSFLARPTLYLEDLFVRPEARRRGLGYALLRHLAREAVVRGCGRMEWVVLHWNEPAKRFYDRAGARLLEDWGFCRLDGDALRKIAGE
jgi:GNAT superfamily N-acetyltransferase